MANIFAIDSKTDQFLIGHIIVNEMVSDMRRHKKPGMAAGLYRFLLSSYAQAMSYAR